MAGTEYRGGTDEVPRDFLARVSVGDPLFTPLLRPRLTVNERLGLPHASRDSDEEMKKALLQCDPRRTRETPSKPHLLRLANGWKNPHPGRYKLALMGLNGAYHTPPTVPS